MAINSMKCRYILSVTLISNNDNKRFMFYFLRGCLSTLVYVVNTVFWCTPLFIGSFLKLLIPLNFWQKMWSYLLDFIAQSWVACNTLNQRVFTPTKITVRGAEQLTDKDWHLVLCNHQSWVDILVLQRVLYGKIPFLKFFLKKELIWVPFLGIAWWALDFPFMRRYSKSFLKKNPHLKGKDIEATRKACEKFKHKPVSVMNFVEGTRFTEAKHQRQNSPFTHLLKPKAGGVAFVINAMAEYLNKLVNVTIYYPQGIPTFMDFASGKVKEIQVDIEVKDIEQSLQGDYSNDKEYRVRFQQQINQLWQAKDEHITSLAEQHKIDNN